MAPPPAPGNPLASVSDLNRRVRALVEGEIEPLWVGGELSNVKQPASGHWYFTLKDASAEVNCALFRGRAQYLDFKPENGQKVEAFGRVTLYEPRGSYQLVVELLRKGGLGALFEAFEKLKAKLDAEGLFEDARKRPLPVFPRAIGVVTSPAAAALRDVLTTLRRRAPMIPVVVYPTPVQGSGAGASIARAIATANARAECDVLIVCRGGGSLEDLWALNVEAVARAIVASRIPVVSGVGHETDFSIADFAADARAPTPTAAAALASPDREALLATVDASRRRLSRAMRRHIEVAMQRLDLAARRLLTPAERLARHRDRVAELATRLAGGIARLLRERRARLAAAAAGLAHLDPTRVLARGYAIVRNAQGAVVRSSAQIETGESIEVRFAEGGADASVTRKR